MENTCTIQLGRWVLKGGSITSFYPTICLEECKSNYVSILVQFVIPLHRFMKEVSYGPIVTRTHCIRMKLYSNTK